MAWREFEPKSFEAITPSEEEVEEYIIHCPILKMYNVLKQTCLAVGNMSVIIVCVLLEEGPQHFFQLVEKTGVHQSTIHYALKRLEGLGLIYIDKDFTWHLKL